MFANPIKWLRVVSRTRKSISFWAIIKAEPVSSYRKATAKIESKRGNYLCTLVTITDLIKCLSVFFNRARRLSSSAYMHIQDTPRTLFKTSKKKKITFRRRLRVIPADAGSSNVRVCLRGQLQSRAILIITEILTENVPILLLRRQLLIIRYIFSLDGKGNWNFIRSPQYCNTSYKNV